MWPRKRITRYTPFIAVCLARKANSKTKKATNFQERLPMSV